MAELLESQGVRTALLELPDDVSGLTLMEPSLSFFVVANRRHAVTRRRFSWVHEYGHVLFDRSRRGSVSRLSDRRDLSEVRANAFAATFLLPEDGVHGFLEEIGKGRPSREHWEVWDDQGAVPAEGRAEPGSQELQLYDVVLLAHHFGVSRSMALYRLKNLELIQQGGLDALLAAEAERGWKVERSLGLPDWETRKRRERRNAREEEAPTAPDFRSRFLALALEAYRRDKISRGKLRRLARLVAYPLDSLDDLVRASGLEPDEEDEVLLPGA